MSKHKLETLGYTSWVELYDDMVKEDLQDEPRVELYWPGGEAPPVTLSMDEIKAGAFGELYPMLPLKASVDVVKDMAETIANGAGKSIVEFLNKIPTRTK